MLNLDKASRSIPLTLSLNDDFNIRVGVCVGFPFRLGLGLLFLSLQRLLN